MTALKSKEKMGEANEPMALDNFKEQTSVSKRALLIASLKKWALGWTIVIFGGMAFSAIFASVLSPLF